MWVGMWKEIQNAQKKMLRKKKKMLDNNPKKISGLGQTAHTR